MAIEDNNKVVVHRVWQEMLIEGKLDLASELVDPAYVYHGPGGYEAKGPEGFKLYISALRESLADLSISNVGVNDLIAEKDIVLSRWTMRGTQKELKRQLTIFGITVTRVVDGRMVEDWEIFDRLSIAEQAANNELERSIIGSITKQFKKMQP